jgi:hypothetical protein
LTRQFAGTWNTWPPCRSFASALIFGAMASVIDDDQTVPPHAGAHGRARKFFRLGPSQTPARLNAHHGPNGAFARVFSSFNLCGPSRNSLVTKPGSFFHGFGFALAAPALSRLRVQQRRTGQIIC